MQVRYKRQTQQQPSGRSVMRAADAAADQINNHKIDPDTPVTKPTSRPLIGVIADLSYRLIIVFWLGLLVGVIIWLCALSFYVPVTEADAFFILALVGVWAGGFIYSLRQAITNK